MAVLRQMQYVSDVRDLFIDLYRDKNIADNGTYEIINASFIADKPTIFGKVNEDYVRREIEWYRSCSLNVNEIEPPIPEIWKQVADKFGYINSNYGWCIFAPANGEQYKNAITTLVDDPTSRQAVMIYNRPSMYVDAFKDGRKDFICTHSTQIFIRAGYLHYIVNMRSNDAVFGYKNDRAWHEWVWNLCLAELGSHHPGLKKGVMYWNAGSLHVYPRHFNLIEEVSNGISDL